MQMHEKWEKVKRGKTLITQIFLMRNGIFIFTISDIPFKLTAAGKNTKNQRHDKESSSGVHVEYTCFVCDGPRGRKINIFLLPELVGLFARESIISSCQQ